MKAYTFIARNDDRRLVLASVVISCLVAGLTSDVSGAATADMREAFSVVDPPVIEQLRFSAELTEKTASFSAFKIEPPITIAGRLNPVRMGLKAGAREVVEKRTEKTATFQLAPGSFVAVSGGAPLFTKDDAGALVPVETDGTVEGDSFVFKRLASRVAIDFDLAHPSYTLEQDGRGFTVRFAAEATGVVKNPTTVAYRLADGVTLRWTVVGNGVKEEILVEKPGPLPDLSFTVRPIGRITMERRGGIFVLKEKDKEIFSSREPVLLNEAGVRLSRPITLAPSRGGFRYQYDANGLPYPYVIDPSSGPKDPGTISNDNSIGTVAWSDTSNAGASDDSYATVSTEGGISNYLKATNFGFSIPNGAAINGIAAEIERYSAMGGIEDEAVRIVKGGSIGSTDRSAVGTWDCCTDPNTYVSYGSSSDAWGETWTASDINASTFGVALAGNDTALDFAYVDHMRITVHYTVTKYVSGTVFTDRGITPISAGKLVAVSLNGGPRKGSGYTLAGGLYKANLTGATMTGGTIVAVYLENETEDAVMVTLGSGSSMTGMHLWQNHLVVRSDSGSVAMTNARLRTARANNDADMTAIYAVDSGDNLQIAGPKSLFVWPEKNYTPGGRVKVYTFVNSGTVAMGTNGLIASGSLISSSELTSSTGILLISKNTTSTLRTAYGNLKNLTINSGLTGYWKFDEGAGAVGSDGTGYGTGASLLNGTTWGSISFPSLQFPNPKYLQFDGVNDTVDLGLVPPLQGSKNFTIAFWAYRPAAIRNRLFTKNGLDIQVSWWSDSRVYFDVANESQRAIANSVGINTWHHMAFTLAGGTSRVFINGVQAGSATEPDGIASNGAHFRVSTQRLGTDQWYAGRIDDLRMYSRALSLSEIKALYNGNPHTGSGVYVLAAPLSISGSLNIYGGALDVSSDNHPLTISGSLNNQGGFTARNGTVTLIGKNQALSGSTTFYNLTKTTTAPDTLLMDYRSRQNISGALILRGEAGNLLSIRSSRIGSGAAILLDGDTGSQTIDYLDVKDSNAAGGTALTCLTATEGCVNSGNNTNWAFAPTLGISGTVYADKGLTPLTSGTVAVSVNGAAAGSSDAVDGGGQYTVTGVPMAESDILTLYLDGGSDDAVTVTLGTGSNMTGIHLYKDHLIVRHDTGSTVTNANLNTADNSGDNDIAEIYSVDGSNTLQVTSNKSLFVWPGKSFTPGARVKTYNLSVSGSLVLGTNGLVVSGSLLARTGTLSTSTGIILLSKSTSAKLSLGSNTVQNVTINNGLVGYWNLDDGVGLTARDRSPLKNHGTLTGGPAWSGSNLLQMKYWNPGAMRFDGTDDYIINTNGASITPYAQSRSVTFWFKPQATGTQRGIISVGNSIAEGSPLWLIVQKSTNVLSVYHGTGYRDGTTALTAGTWYHGAYTFDAATSAVKLYLNGAQEYSGTVADSNLNKTNLYIAQGYNGYFSGTMDDVRIYSRSLALSEVKALYNGNRNTGSGVYVLGSPLSVSGALNIYAGGIDVSAGNYQVTLSGSLNNQGDFIARSGLVKLTGANQTLSGSTAFYSLTRTTSIADTLSFDYTSRQNISGALILRGAASNLLSIRSSRIGSGAAILLDGDTGTQTIDYLNVKDSNASGGAELVCQTATEGCVDSGNAINWTFASGSVPPPGGHFFFFWD